MIQIPSQFAIHFALDFYSRTRIFGGRASEVPLFSEMKRSLQYAAAISNGSSLCIEKYHGNSHQVIFSPATRGLRPTCRCELSDLMIIIFSPTLKQARLTFLQAKYEKQIRPFPCLNSYEANIEQWDLLSNRPSIKGALSSFCPPRDLLSAAILPSIGTFAFFIELPNNNFQIFYVIASELSLARFPGNSKYCRLKPKAYPICGTHNYCAYFSGGHYSSNSTTPGSHNECLVACGNVAFADQLYRMKIGSPIGQHNSSTAGTREWLGRTLSHLIERNVAPNFDATLIREFMRTMEIPASDGGRINDEQQGARSSGFGARSLLILKSNLGEG